MMKAQGGNETFKHDGPSGSSGYTSNKYIPKLTNLFYDWIVFRINNGLESTPRTKEDFDKFVASKIRKNAS